MSLVKWTSKNLFEFKCISKVMVILMQNLKLITENCQLKWLVVLEHSLTFINVVVITCL